MKFKNIVVSGDISTGKSTLAHNLARELNWEYLSTGEYFRKWHKEHNIPLEKTNQVPESVDKEIDYCYQQKMKNEERIVFESHLGGYLAKDLLETFKVLCVTDWDKRIERAAKRDGINLEEAYKNVFERSKMLADKFKKLYGVENTFDPKYFNLIVDTSEKSPQDVLDVVLKSLKYDTRSSNSDI